MIDGQHFIHKCVQDKPIDQFVAETPRGVHILTLAWYIDYMAPWERVQETPQKRGITYARVSPHRVNVNGVFEGIDHKKMLSNIKVIIKHFKVPVNKMYVRRAILSDGKTQITLKRTYKNIRLAEDKRKKLFVLGMYNQNGKIAHNVTEKNICYPLLKRMSAFDVDCRRLETGTPIVVCSTRKMGD